MSSHCNVQSWSGSRIARSGSFVSHRDYFHVFHSESRDLCESLLKDRVVSSVFLLLVPVG